jgi:hypothetical protein
VGLAAIVDVIVAGIVETGVLVFAGVRVVVPVGKGVRVSIDLVCTQPPPRHREDGSLTWS